MIEYQAKNKKFLLNLEKESIQTEDKSKIINLSISQNTSSLIISTEKNPCMILDFQEMLMFPKSLKPSKKHQNAEKKLNNFIKKEKKESGNFLLKPIFELNPSMEEGLQMAIGLGKSVNILQISKGKLIEVKHGENSKCKFIQWENDLLICAFENRVIKIIKNYYYEFKSFTDEDIITSMKIVHWQKSNLLVIGNNKKVKILDFLTISENEFRSQVITRLEGKIDTIEHKNQYILFCSKENKIIYCFHFLNNDSKLKMLFEINLFNITGLDPEEELINVKLISSEGIIVSLKNVIYLFYIKNNKYILNYTIKEPQDNISFSSLIFDRKKYYLIYSLRNNIKIIEILINQKEASNSIYQIDFDLESSKKKINTCINTLLNRKNDFSIKKLDDFALQIKYDLATVKLEFNLEDLLSLNFSVLNCLDDTIKNKLVEEIDRIKLNDEEIINDYNEYVIEKIIFLNKIINSDISESFNSDIESEIDKLKKEKFLFHYETFRKWQEITKAKIPIKNLFNDDEYEFDLDNKIMKEPLKSFLPKWNFNFNDLKIDDVFDFATKNFYSSSYDDNIDKNKKNKNIYEEINNDTAVIYKLNKESLKIYLNNIEEKKKIQNENILILVDILSQIKYYFQEITKQNSINLIKLFRENILEILIYLESTLNFVFLFICIIPISELIYNEINKRSNITLNIKNSPLKDYLENKYQRNSDENINKKINKKNSISWSSENENDEMKDIISENDDKDSLFLDFEADDSYTGKNKDNFEQQLNKYNNINNYSKENNKNKKDADIKSFSFSKKNSKDGIDFIRSKKKNLTNRLYKNNLSFSSNKLEKNLIEILTSSFCNSIIDYVIFFSEELKLLNEEKPDERLIDFFNLGIKFYKTQDIYNEISEIGKKIY